MHVVHDEVRDAKVSIDQPVDLEVVVIFPERVDQSFGNLSNNNINVIWSAVWPDWAIYWTLGKFLKPLATTNLPKSPTFLGNFCKGVKSNHFSSEIIFGQLL